MSHIRIYNKLNLKFKKQTLRRKATEAEKLLWAEIRKDKLGVRFHRQYGIGPCIVDFYCPSRKLALEIDGEQHKTNRDYDNYRTGFISAMGITVVRFWNHEITNDLDQVLRQIQKRLGTSP